MQDHDRAVLVGTPTYGKGVLQTTYPLGDEVAIKLTTARWYTPTGRWVQRPQAEANGAPGNRTPAMEPQVFRTPMGRPIPDRSGILPDLMVRTSFRSDGERTLHLALGDDLDRFRQVLTRVRGGAAHRLRGERRIVRRHPEHARHALRPAGA